MATGKRSEWVELARFVALMLLGVLALRSLMVAPFFIPSESMLPRLLIGDYLLVEKWPYGYTRWSLPFGALPVSGRVLGRPPARGDVVVFRSPEPQSHDVIKRVIGLPGDTIQVRRGQVILNGQAVPRARVADFVLPITPNFTRCPAAHVEGSVCRFQRYRETLPGGRSFDVLDTAPGMEGDDTALYAVPVDHVFLMGDNRDNSADSRYPAPLGMGYVPMDRLEGRAGVTFFSTDGSAAWLKPWTWVTAARFGRVGGRF